MRAVSNKTRIETYIDYDSKKLYVHTSSMRAVSNKTRIETASLHTGNPGDNGV